MYHVSIQGIAERMINAHWLLLRVGLCTVWPEVKCQTLTDYWKLLICNIYFDTGEHVCRTLNSNPLQTSTWHDQHQPKGSIGKKWHPDSNGTCYTQFKVSLTHTLPQLLDTSYTERAHKKNTNKIKTRPTERAHTQRVLITTHSVLSLAVGPR